MALPEVIDWDSNRLDTIIEGMVFVNREDGTQLEVESRCIRHACGCATAFVRRCDGPPYFGVRLDLWLDRYDVGLAAALFCGCQCDVSS